mgnify:FL=1|tara:strand:+ start:195 stop:659 length:465 start_codon:yes stop_codon:yes gene_type:complete
MKKYLLIVLFVGFGFGQIKILKMETQHKTFNKGELKSIIGNKILYQNSNQFLKKGKIDSINIATINKIIFSPSFYASMPSSLLALSILPVWVYSIIHYEWKRYHLILGANLNTVFTAISAIYLRLELLKKNTLKMDSLNESEKILHFEELLLLK